MRSMLHCLFGKVKLNFLNNFSFRCIKFINKNAYIEIAISGTSFITSAKEAMRLIFGNVARVSLIAGKKI